MTSPSRTTLAEDETPMTPNEVRKQLDEVVPPLADLVLCSLTVEGLGEVETLAIGLLGISAALWRTLDRRLVSHGQALQAMSLIAKQLREASRHVDAAVRAASGASGAKTANPKD